MIKYLLTFLLFISSGLLSAQEVTSTGNIVDPTKWNNVIYMNAGQLSQVEGQGGGPIPAFNTDTNTIRFSFMPYTVSQIIAINSVLSGQGISVGGFNYSWKIYNDLENCCGTRGSLFVNGSLTNKSGQVIESYFYDYSLTNTGPAFQTFTGTETFKNPYQLNSLGDISISWTGSDMNFWSGYYGPRVRDTSLTLNYTVSQPASNTTPTTTTNATTAALNEIIATASEPVVAPTTAQTASADTTTQSSTTSAPTTASTTTMTAPVSTTAAVATVEVTKEKSVTGPSLSSILTNIKNNQDRQNAIAMAAVADSNNLAASVVQQAEKTAMDSANASATNSNVVTGVGFTLSSESKVFQTARNLSPITTTISNMNNGNVYALRPETRNTDSTFDSQSIFQENKVQLLKSPSNDTLFGNSNSDNINNFGIAFGKRGDPIQDYIEASNLAFNEMRAEPKAVVRSNIQDNDLAGGVKIERMAVVPNGFSAYSAFILTNIAFYEPKEIYKNNVPKDNVRSMYFLEKGNTDTFNKMIEAQYK